MKIKYHFGTKSKLIKLTKREQDVAAEILTKFMFANSLEDMIRIWQSIYKEYKLKNDFFIKDLYGTDEFYKMQNDYEKLEEYDFYDEF